jgi:hypothetical protein
MTTENDQDSKQPTRDLEEMRRKAATFPTRMLADVYLNAKKSGDTELAAIYREILKARK